MKKTVAILFLCVFAVIAMIIFSGSAAHSQEKAPEKKSDGCITSECHAKINQHKFVHGPIAAGECTACHGGVPKHKERPKRYKFGKIKDIPKICFSCHEEFKPKKFTHDPVKEGECTACHASHGSQYKFQLLKQGGALCFECHDEDIVANKYVHGPAAVGACVACHEPHTADYEKNLKAQGSALCFTCHTDQAEAFQKAKVIHKPVAEDCAKCHNPHSAPKKFMLAEESPDLCFSCHEDKKKWVEMVAVRHGALMMGKACLNCHEPHVSDVAKGLSLTPMELCLSCHDKEMETPDGELLADMKKLLAESKDHHGPIRQKDCSGCHDPHGSGHFRILRNPYPATFYLPYILESYNLCFICHEKSIVQDPETSKLTNFRNGEVNLHFIHVNKPEKGRTCRACHETHASNYPKHIRESVPFGTWELPLNYEKTETGGSCTPGCHKIKKYDRIKSVENL